VLRVGVSNYLLQVLLWMVTYKDAPWGVPGAFVFTVGLAAGQGMQDDTIFDFRFITPSTIRCSAIVPVAHV
jgi:hypothetical protein